MVVKQYVLGNVCQGEPILPPYLLLTPQLLHSMLLTHWAMVEQMAGQWTPRGPPEASEDKKGSTVSTVSAWD